jgi:uncharacterized membrane protein (UPF0127 family)
MAWLLREGEVLATLEVADGWRDRTRGLIGRDGIDGALLLRPARSVHRIGMRFPIEVACCTAGMEVARVTRMRPNRVTRPVFKAQCVIEAEAGTFGRWGLRPGDRLEIKGE